MTDIFIGDHHQDTLAFIQKIETSFKDFKKLQQNDFDFSLLEASGVYLNIKKYPNEEVHSLKVLVQKLRKESKNRNKPILNVSEVDFVNTKFNYTDLNSEEKPIQVDSLNIKAQNFNFTADSLLLELNTLKGYLVSPVKEQFSTSAKVFYRPGMLYLSDWNLSAADNQLSGALNLVGANNSFRNFNKEGTFKWVVNESQLKTERFSSSPFLAKSPVKASFVAKGSLDDFDLEKLRVVHDEFDVEGKLKLQNLLDSSKMNWEFTVSNASLSKVQLLEQNKHLIVVNDYFTGESVQFKGRFKSNTKAIDFDLESQNAWGNFKAKGAVDQGLFMKENKDKAITVEAAFDSINFLLPTVSKKEFSWGGLVQFEGNLAEKGNEQLEWDVREMFLKTPTFSLSNIEIEGNFTDQQLRNTLSVNDSIMALKSDFRFDFSDTQPQYTLAANISKWDINLFGLRLGEAKRNFKGVVLGNFKGKNIDNLEGAFKVSAAQITNEDSTVDLNPLTISQKIIQGETLLTIENTDCISGAARGKFQTSQLVQLFQQTLHQVYPFLPLKEPREGQELSFKLTIYKKLLDALYPEFSVSENIFLKGNIGSDIKSSIVTLDAPLMRWNGLQLEELHFQIDTKNPIYNTYLSVNRISQEYIKGRAFNMISTKLKDTLYFRSEFTNQAKEKTPFELNFYHTMGTDGISYFGFKKSKFPLGKETWVLNPEDTPNQKIGYNAKTNETILTDLLAVTEDQLIELSGAYSNSKKFNLDLEIENVILENILPVNPVFRQSGIVDLKAKITRSSEENKLEFSTAISDWNINGQNLGQFDLSANGNTLMNAYVVALNLDEENKKSLSARGVWQGFEKPTLNLDLDLNEFNLGFLSPLGKDAIQNINGAITGNVNLWGPLDEIRHNGVLNLEKAQIRIPYLNLDYQAESTQILLSNQDFTFKDVKLNERAEGTSAEMNGTFSHDNFRDWSLQMDIESDRMLLLNTQQVPESLFFGQGFLNGNLNLSGPTKNLKISLQGATETGTSIKIPWAESYGLSDSSFVNFIDKKIKREVTPMVEEKTIKEIRGVEMDFELDVTNNASIEIVIDQETGSYLSGRGAGNLFMEINTNGKFNMWGDFITFDGIYNFKNLGVIDKKFNVKPGGTIVWEGNPLEAQMDLEAVYSVPGGANPALLLDNPNFNKSIPTEVLIRLQGNLLKPDDPVFEIDFPNTSGTVASEINYRLADPQRSQLQALSLLSQGIFINEVSVSMQGITNNLYQKASDIVSNLIGEENDKLKVGIDYLQGDKSALLDIATEDRLGFTLSTKISDRILLNGKIGVPVGGVEQTLIVGNIQIDFILNDEGSLRAKVFNKENEFRYIGDELGYTQGVGLSYDVDFNTFKDLIQKVVNSQDLESQSTQTETNQTPSGGVRFVKKGNL